jgi:hypothetical protein
MHLGFHKYSADDPERIEEVKEELGYRRRQDLSESMARRVFKYATENGIKTDVFSYVTGVYDVPREELDEERAANAVWPVKVLDTESVQELHEFAETTMENIDARYDIDSLRERRRDSDESRRELFDSDTSDAFSVWGILNGVRRLTQIALENDWELYYGEGDIPPSEYSDERKEEVGLD